MSVSQARTLATNMLHVPIPLDHSNARVNLAILVMEHSAQVNLIPVSVPKMLFIFLTLHETSPRQQMRQTRKISNVDDFHVLGHSKCSNILVSKLFLSQKQLEFVRKVTGNHFIA